MSFFLSFSLAFSLWFFSFRAFSWLAPLFSTVRDGLERGTLTPTSHGTVFFGCCLAGAALSTLLPEVRGRDPDVIYEEELRVARQR